MNMNIGVNFRVCTLYVQVCAYASFINEAPDFSKPNVKVQFFWSLLAVQNVVTKGKRMEKQIFLCSLGNNDGLNPRPSQHYSSE